jgi:hypothetical protein
MRLFTASIPVTLSFISVLWGASANAFTIIEGGHRISVGTTYRGNFYMVNTIPNFLQTLAVGGTAAQRQIMTNEFPGWTFNPATAAAPGTLTVEEYDAIAVGDSGGVDISLLYDDGNPTPTTTWRWIQIVESISEEVGYPYPKNPSVDPPKGFDDDLPFYFTNTELGGFSPNIEGDSIWKGKTPIPIQNPANRGDLRFFDEPQGFLENAYMRNNFSLFLTSWSGGDSKTVTIYDGVAWGFEIKKVPEPLTLIASGLAIGFGALSQREYSKKRQQK